VMASYAANQPMRTKRQEFLKLRSSFEAVEIFSFVEWSGDLIKIPLSLEKRSREMDLMFGYWMGEGHEVDSGWCSHVKSDHLA